MSNLGSFFNLGSQTTFVNESDKRLDCNLEHHRI